MSQNEYEERKPIIYLAGIGMGQDDQLTGEVLDCLDRADAVMGARRMLDAAAPYTEGKAVLAAFLFLRQTRQKLAECSQYQQPWPQLRRSFPYPSL